jgi:2,5-furandicarboxylate decarboxylase 1
MILEDYIKKLRKNGKITTVSRSISKNLEIAGVLKTLEPEPVLFENVKESEFRVAGNLFCNKMQISDYFGITTEQIIPTLANAIENRSKPEQTENGPCQEVIEEKVDLDKIPILFHNKVDGGPYISSSVVVAADPEYGQNLDFHRAMQFSKDKMVQMH